MKAKHTKAPWGGARRGAYRDMNGQSVVILGDDKRICVVHHHKTPEDDANVALIASAPKLLETLKAVMACMQEKTPWDDAKIILTKAHEVIREAEGNL